MDETSKKIINTINNSENTTLLKSSFKETSNYKLIALSIVVVGIEIADAIRSLRSKNGN